MADDRFTPFFKSLFLPKYLSGFRDTSQEITVLYFKDLKSEPVEIKVNPYPFMTLYDLKILLYQHFGKELFAHPSYQSLLLPGFAFANVKENEEVMDFSVNVRKISNEYTPFEFGWVKPESTDELHLQNPFLRASGGSIDSQFVTESGKKNLQFVIRNRMTIEDYLANIHKDKKITLHLFLYKDILPGMRPELRDSEREWFGRIGPYYPDLEMNQSPASLSSQLLQRARIFDSYVEGCLQQMKTLDSLLAGDEVPLLPITVAGCKFLRLVWKEPKKQLDSLESLFYKLDVTHERPFMRILPVGATAITKLKMLPALKVPDISDPRLLLNWKDERNPKPDKDFLFSKLIIRRTMGTQPALYGTLRLFHDTSADMIIMPPKQLRVLDPRTDLSALGSLMTEGLKGFPIEEELPEIGEATLICAIRLPLKTKLLTTERLRRRLASFGAMFQEIPALPGDKPLLMLRYKGVSNYAVEDRIFTFLTLLVSRMIVKGEAAIPELVVGIQKEFQLSEEEAQSKVVYWIRNRGQIQLAVPETKDFITTYNTGIDIAIFGQQSYYTLHLYRLDSSTTFQRIITALSLLLSADDTDLQLEAPVAEQRFAEVAAAVAVVSPGSDLPPGAPLAAAPANVGIASEDSEESLESANNSNSLYARLMLGGPGAEGDEEEEGEGELLNLGDPLENARRENVGQVNIAERVEQNNRAVAAASSRAVEALPIRPEPQPQTQPQPQPQQQEEEEDGKKSYQGWVKSQLQAADERLFLYKTDIEGRKIKKYVTMCQATESRQPYVLNQEQFDVMRETYKEDIAKEEMDFQIYPLEKGEALVQNVPEVYTVLKYGTNPSRQNYYLCCQFFCTKDYILVREKDFYSRVDRQGNPKPGESVPGKKDLGSCPFCHKLEIKNLKAPNPDESVLQRRTKKGDVKRHLYVSFLQGETQHPEEFYMPCCFTEDTVLYSSDPRFDKVRGEEKEDEEEIKTTAGVPAISYQITLNRAHKKYIIGPEKEVLKISDIDGPQIGLLPSVIDRYFGQDPKEFVSREANKMELLPNANCFLRVAVENRTAYRHDSFFAAIAPYLNYRTTAAAVKARIQEVITPRIFTFLNYGNMVLEFYEPGDPGPTREILRKWASKELQIELNDTNQDSAMRIWKSYTRFLGFLDSTRTKEYRQFAQMLALPGLVTTRGLLLIVLDMNEENELSVRCPPFGYNEEQYSSSDIAFILHRSSGIWEPIFFTSNRPQTARFQERHQPEITFQKSEEVDWPPIVKQRTAEFIRQCRSIGRGAYTSRSKINPMTLIPLSAAIQAIPTVIGVVRDSYNHVVAITYRSQEKKAGLVALPVIDDEFPATNLMLHFDWDDFTPAPMESVLKVYTERIEPVFSLYPGYKPVRRVKSRGTNQYVAIQLANGLFIPASPPKNESLVESLKLTYVDEMEWSMNREIYFSKGEKKSEEALFQASEQDMNEIFQHLRLTFSNWFSSEAVSSEFRNTVKKIIDFRDIPLFERRKRLEILLGPEVLSWMDTEAPKGEQEASLLRIDCRLRAEASCTAKCVWRQKGEDVGKCYLHAPTDFKLGGRRVNGPRLLMLRLIEELLRFPDRKQQLLTGTVPTLASLKDAIRIGDQYILPEKSAAWYDLLRLDWIETSKETKKFYEEMSRKVPEGEEEEEEKEEEKQPLGKPLPKEIEEIFGKDDPRTKKLFVIAGPPSDRTLNPLLVPLGVSTGDIDVEYDSSTMNREEVKRLAALTRRPILFVDTLFEPAEVYAYGLAKGQKSSIPYILIHTEEGPFVVSSSKKSLQDIVPEEMPSGLYALYKDRRMLVK